MRIVDTGPDAYLASLPDEHRDTLTPRPPQQFRDYICTEVERCL